MDRTLLLKRWFVASAAGGVVGACILRPSGISIFVGDRRVLVKKPDDEHFEAARMFPSSGAQMSCLHIFDEGSRAVQPHRLCDSATAGGVHAKKRQCCSTLEMARGWHSMRT